jgi:hypothetical protein
MCDSWSFRAIISGKRANEIQVVQVMDALKNIDSLYLKKSENTGDGVYYVADEVHAVGTIWAPKDDTKFAHTKIRMALQKKLGKTGIHIKTQWWPDECVAQYED